METKITIFKGNKIRKTLHWAFFILFLSIACQSSSTKLGDSQPVTQNPRQVQKLMAALYGELGFAQQSLDFYEEARSLYLQAIKTDSMLADPHVRLAAILYQLDKNSEAAKSHLELVLKDNPNHALALMYLGQFLANEGVFDRAIELLKMAVEKASTEELKKDAQWRLDNTLKEQKEMKWQRLIEDYKNKGQKNEPDEVINIQHPLSNEEWQKQSQIRDKIDAIVIDGRVVGVVLTSVLPGSLFESRGLKTHDVILKLNQIDFSSSNFWADYGNNSFKEPLTFLVLREGKLIEIKSEMTYKSVFDRQNLK